MAIPIQIAPHGGALVDRVLAGAARDSALDRAGRAPQVTLNPVGLSDLIGNGAFSPLTGFAVSADYHSVMNEMRLGDGSVWSIPVTLAVSREVAESLHIGDDVALVEEGGRVRGILELAEKYDVESEHEDAFTPQDLRLLEGYASAVARLWR